MRTPDQERTYIAMSPRSTQEDEVKETESGGSSPVVQPADPASDAATDGSMIVDDQEDKESVPSTDPGLTTDTDDERKRSQSDAELPSPPFTPRRRTSHSSEQRPATAEDNAPEQSSNNEVHRQARSDFFMFDSTFSECLDVMEKHIDTNELNGKVNGSQPPSGDYLFTMSCVPTVVTQCKRDPMAWLQQEREYLEQLDRARRRRTGEPTPPPAEPTQRTMRTRTRKATTTGKPAETPKKRTQPKRKPAKRAPANNGDKPKRNSQKDTTRHEDLKDYSPPIETLAESDKTLRADWKGRPLDLSDDPDRHLLHPLEIQVASTLRLDCNAYLVCKRRLFKQRVDFLREGRNFHKTAAQQSCCIDVNKASALWIAFERVGWCNPKHFEQYL
ncbi:hypothetical protein KEM55_003207 [Ascosphaera atra]|nr:hypothetical protein KEM55_003207 [Ascosphaera atra]